MLGVRHSLFYKAAQVHRRIIRSPGDSRDRIVGAPGSLDYPDIFTMGLCGERSCDGKESSWPTKRPAISLYGNRRDSLIYDVVFTVSVYSAAEELEKNSL